MHSNIQTKEEEMSIIPGPCPFCGGKALPDIGNKNGSDVDEWFVICQCCAAEGPWFHERGNAIAAWNARPAAPEAERLVDELIGAVNLSGRCGYTYNPEHDTNIADLRARIIARMGRGMDANALQHIHDYVIAERDIPNHVAANIIQMVVEREYITNQPGKE
jgi:Lar family restriction alleviation protein